jgi:thioesterase domain-containing protein
VSGVVRQLDLASVSDSLNRILPIRTGGDRPPFFFVHPASGLSWCYRPLARYVTDGIPLYGLQAAGMDGSDELPDSIAAMAAEYVEQIRAVQPSGPYHLIGFSFGGIPVHEIAIRLQAAGETVGALVVMDAYPPPPARPDQVTEPVQAAAPPEPTAPPGDEPDADTRLRATAARIREEVGEIIDGISDDELLLITKIFRNNTSLRRRHEPGVFDGDMLLFVAEGAEGAEGRDESDSPDARKQRWEPYVRGTVSAVGLPCRHGDLMQPDMLRQAWEAIAEWLE